MYPSSSGSNRVFLLASFPVTGAADAGQGTLRQVILFLDSSTDNTNTILFDIKNGTQTISLRSPLPPITAPVFLDGSSQPDFAGSPLIGLDGRQLESARQRPHPRLRFRRQHDPGIGHLRL